MLQDFDAIEKRERACADTGRGVDILGVYFCERKSLFFRYLEKIHGGGGEIRTRDTVSRIHTFQACALNHSATPPSVVL